MVLLMAEVQINMPNIDISSITIDELCELANCIRQDLRKTRENEERVERMMQWKLRRRHPLLAADGSLTIGGINNGLYEQGS